MRYRVIVEPVDISGTPTGDPAFSVIVEPTGATDVFRTVSGGGRGSSDDVWPALRQATQEAGP